MPRITTSLQTGNGDWHSPDQGSAGRTLSSSLSKPRGSSSTRNHFGRRRSKPVSSGVARCNMFCVGRPPTKRSHGRTSVSAVQHVLRRRAAYKTKPARPNRGVARCNTFSIGRPTCKTKPRPNPGVARCNTFPSEGHLQNEACGQPSVLLRRKTFLASNSAVQNEATAGPGCCTVQQVLRRCPHVQNEATAEPRCCTGRTRFASEGRLQNEATAEPRCCTVHVLSKLVRCCGATRVNQKPCPLVKLPSSDDRPGDCRGSGGNEPLPEGAGNMSDPRRRMPR